MITANIANSICMHIESYLEKHTEKKPGTYVDMAKAKALNGLLSSAKINPRNETTSKEPASYPVGSFFFPIV